MPGHEDPRQDVADRLTDLNNRIANREVKYVDGNVIDEQRRGAYHRKWHDTLPCDDGIPVMLEEQGITLTAARFLSEPGAFRV